MVDSSSRRNFLRVAGGSTVLALAGCISGDDNDDNQTGNGDDNGMDNGGDNGMDNGMDVYPEEAATGGAVWLTPGAWAVHTGENPIFEQGQQASIGLEALAEAGPPTGFEGEPGLVNELPEVASVVSAGAYTPADTVADPNDPTGAPRQGNNGGARAGATEGVVHPVDVINDPFEYADAGDVVQVTLEPQ